MSLQQARRDASFVGWHGAILRERLWFVLKVYADESGTHDRTGEKPGSAVAAIGGFLAWASDWDAFEPEWERYLDEYGVKDFHMTHYMRKRVPPYRDWSTLKWEAFGRGLRQIALRHARAGLGGLLVVKDYQKCAPAIIQKQTSPYAFCFQTMIQTVLKRVETLPGITASDQVAFIFDQNQQHAPDAKVAYDQIKAKHDKRDRLGSITFDSRKQQQPLRAADMMAWLVRHELTTLKPNGRLSTIGRDLARSGKMDVGYYDRGNLTTLFEQMRRDGAI